MRRTLKALVILALIGLLTGGGGFLYVQANFNKNFCRGTDYHAITDSYPLNNSRYCVLA